MALRLLGHIELPPNRSKGGFDHADVHQGTDRLYVAHTSNDAVDVIDTARDRYIESISGFTAVAGALVSEARGLVFTSNRGEDTVSVFAPGIERQAFKIAVGVKPNGLAFDSARGILIAANVGDPSISDSYTVSIVDLARRERIAEVKVPGRTRWAIYDESRELFFVNIASPARIIAIDARDPNQNIEGVRYSGGGTARIGSRSSHGPFDVRLRCWRTTRNRSQTLAVCLAMSISVEHPT